MDHKDAVRQFAAPAGTALAPIWGPDKSTPLRICALVSATAPPSSSCLVLLRELPGSRVYLGAVCDAAARIQEWVEIWVQCLDARDMASAGYQEHLTNFTFDERWRAEFAMSLEGMPELVVVTGLEDRNPSPMTIKLPAVPNAPLAHCEPVPWQICQDDALLESFGLPRYSTTPFRYLHDPKAGETKTFVATNAEAPSNSHVISIDRVAAGPGVREIFNPQAGLIRVMRLSPLGMEEYLQTLEGKAWPGLVAGVTPVPDPGIYGELRAWSNSPKGMPFLLCGMEDPATRLNEIFFLKLTALLAMFKAVRGYAKSRQLPLLNLSPSSFGVRLPEVGSQFPALWSAQCSLAKAGQAHALKIKSTAQKYFLRLGRFEPSPFLPEGLGSHSSGIGSVRLRSVIPETDGMVLEGTLVAEDFLRVDANDLLWFKVPLTEGRLEFYAHVHTGEAVGPREARFRTVPARIADPLTARLKAAAGTTFAKSPYEVWPLLSSPCDLYSLGIIAIRTLLTNGKSNLPVVVDDVLSLARHLGKDPAKSDELLPRLKSLAGTEQALLDLISPHSLVEGDWLPETARGQIQLDIWLETMSVLLRLFPGAGSHSYCRDFGDVSPLALETVFNRPIEELESLALRLRSILLPSLSANDEIAAAVREFMAS